MIFNIKTFDNLIRNDAYTVDDKTSFNKQIEKLTKLPAQKSVIYNEKLLQYKKLVPCHKINSAAYRGSSVSELLGDGSQHFKTQIKIAQANVTVNDYSAD
jgi:hypothetical protein